MSTNPPIRAGKRLFIVFLGEPCPLKPGGELWLVIQKKQGAPSAFEKLEELFDEVEVVDEKERLSNLSRKKEPNWLNIDLNYGLWYRYIMPV